MVIMTGVVPTRDKASKQALCQWGVAKDSYYTHHKSTTDHHAH
jgi:hypothetical protein